MLPLTCTYSNLGYSAHFAAHQAPHAHHLLPGGETHTAPMVPTCESCCPLYTTAVLKMHARGGATESHTQPSAGRIVQKEEDDAARTASTWHSKSQCKKPARNQKESAMRCKHPRASCPLSGPLPRVRPVMPGARIAGSKGRMVNTAGFAQLTTAAGCDLVSLSFSTPSRTHSLQLPCPLKYP